MAKQQYAVMKWTNDSNRLSSHNLKHIIRPRKFFNDYEVGEAGSATYPGFSGEWDFVILAIGETKQEMDVWLRKYLEDIAETRSGDAPETLRKKVPNKSAVKKSKTDKVLQQESSAVMALEMLQKKRDGSHLTSFKGKSLRKITSFTEMLSSPSPRSSTAPRKDCDKDSSHLTRKSPRKIPSSPAMSLSSHSPGSSTTPRKDSSHLTRKSPRKITSFPAMSSSPSPGSSTTPRKDSSHLTRKSPRKIASFPLETLLSSHSPGSSTAPRKDCDEDSSHPTRKSPRKIPSSPAMSLSSHSPGSSTTPRKDSSHLTRKSPRKITSFPAMSSSPSPGSSTTPRKDSSHLTRKSPRKIASFPPETLSSPSPRSSTTHRKDCDEYVTLSQVEQLLEGYVRKSEFRRFKRKLEEEQPPSSTNDELEEIVKAQKNPYEAVEAALCHCFTREEINSHSATGKKANRNTPAKPKFDPVRYNTMARLVEKHFSVTHKEIVMKTQAVKRKFAKANY